MVLGRIVVKNNYDKEGDLVYRPLVRAYLRNGLDSFIEEGNVMLYGIIHENIFYELFTGKEIPYSKYEIIDKENFDELIERLSLKEMKVIKKTINDFVFEKKESNAIDVGTMIDLATDRAVEFGAYNRNLSSINPYSEPLNGYNDFNYKCKVLENK